MPRTRGPQTGEMQKSAPLAMRLQGLPESRNSIGHIRHGCVLTMHTFIDLIASCAFSMVSISRNSTVCGSKS